MPRLEWIGKEKVVNHAKEVPFHVLEKRYSFGEGRDGMVIHGDNLLALKSLLPGSGFSGHFPADRLLFPLSPQGSDPSGRGLSCYHHGKGRVLCHLRRPLSPFRRIHGTASYFVQENSP